MKYRYFVNPMKAVVGAGVALTSFGFGIIMLTIGKPAGIVFFCILGVVYFIIAMVSGAIVSFGETGITKKVLGQVVVDKNWTEVKEIGVCGTKVFNLRHPEKTGVKYIYISFEKLDEDSRFEMVLKWPPKDKIYFVYTKQRLEAIQMISGMKIETYNTNDLRL